MSHRRMIALAPVAALALATCVQPGASAATDPDKTVHSGDTWTVTSTVRLHRLTIEPGATVTAPSGESLTLTVNGVDTGAALTKTGGTDTALQPGTYRGAIVLTVADANPVAWQGLTFPFRQALYVGAAGLQAGSSVPAAVQAGRVRSRSADGILVRSTGEDFNALYATSDYSLRNSRIRLNGNGRSDFVGYGTAVTSTGTGTRVVLDHVNIANHGTDRSAVVATGGSNLVVENSQLSVRDGVLPSDYQSTVDLAVMQDAPWMLGIKGNVRATNLLGDNTKASYLNTSVSSTGWGLLSTDAGSDVQLVAVNDRLKHVGSEGGYGTYAIGNATERILGTTLDVATYASIITGGTVTYGDSTPSAVKAANSWNSIGLTTRRLAAIPTKATVVNSRRFGIMNFGPATENISGHTRFNTKEATFLVKGAPLSLNVDGSQGAQLTPQNGILMQVMTNDDPGPVVVDGKLVNQGVYTEPTGAPVKDTSWDVAGVHDSDAQSTFTHAHLRGDFFNGFRGSATSGMNMVLNFDHSTIAGVLSSSTAKHRVSTIDSSNYQQLDEVDNHAGQAVNNGTIVDLDDAAWTVTGTSYLSKLTVGHGSRVLGAHGKQVTMTVDGVRTPIDAGKTYTGNVVISLS
ncbi:hypothetical protein [Flexivirga oryzae]|uniref:Right-handed parallel beta-helix repeat-containing protein n=1 Tax=Flexivirga oryzae TaxID=1794944 RepID=A0A839N2A4_9MICO|nr:hypothetical protein [Flexivirga oryzae]MBB2891870.1 hypothetical protein [Flexivirga oryzae]